MRLLGEVVVAPVLNVRLGRGFNRAGIEGGTRIDDAGAVERRLTRGEVRGGTSLCVDVLRRGMLRAAIGGIMVEVVVVVVVVVVGVVEPVVCVCVVALMPIFEDRTGTRARNDGVVWMCACAGEGAIW